MFNIVPVCIERQQREIKIAREPDKQACLTDLFVQIQSVEIDLPMKMAHAEWQFESDKLG